MTSVRIRALEDRPVTSTVLTFLEVSYGGKSDGVSSDIDDLRVAVMSDDPHGWLTSQKGIGYHEKVSMHLSIILRQQNEPGYYASQVDLMRASIDPKDLSVLYEDFQNNTAFIAAIQKAGLRLPPIYRDAMPPGYVRRYFSDQGKIFPDRSSCCPV